MKKWDIIIIITLIIISFIPETVIFITTYNKYNSFYVEVYSQGKLLKKLPLKKDAEKVTFTIDNRLGTNIVEIDKAKVKIIDADCPDKICLKDHAISKPGEAIICLPHKLVVKIIGEGKQETDEVSF
ncbi:MAG: NusG domain II-containing protein [Clostridiaceae bacterium]|nr:NusG domain II-containing protein [Clostridiaceae bacterium]